MTKDQVRWRVQTIVNIIDEWLEDIANEEEPKCDLTPAGVDVDMAYKAGAYKARAEYNARRLDRIKGMLLNEFGEMGVQSRLKKV